MRQHTIRGDGRLARWSPAVSMLAILVCLACQGCVVGPDFTGINAERIPANFRSQQSENPTPSITLDQWWQHFSDPTLNQIVQQALSRNLGLLESLERVVESRANYRLQTGQLAPNGSLLGSYEYIKRSENARPFVGSNGDPFNLISLGAAATWEIDLFGRIRRTIEAADADIRQQELDAQNLRRILVGDIASSYVRVRLFQNQTQLALQNLEIQHRTKTLIEERKETGVSTDLDGVQADALISRSRALISVLQQQLHLELNNLALLMGEAPHDGLLAKLGEATIPTPPALPAAGLPADLVRTRPDVQRDERAVAQATALIGVAEADLYPRLTLIGTIGVSAQGISSLFEFDGLSFDAGPSISWNIFNFGRIAANIEINESRARQAYLRYQQTALQAVREVEDTMTQHGAFLEQWIEFQRAVSADLQAAELAFDRYKVGRINFQRLLDTQQQLLQDQQQMALAQANAVDQMVRMFQALGGGWENTQCSNCIQDCDCVNQVESHAFTGTPTPTTTWQHPIAVQPEQIVTGDPHWHEGSDDQISEGISSELQDFPLRDIPTTDTVKDFIPSATPQPSVDRTTEPDVSDMFDAMTLDWDDAQTP